MISISTKQGSARILGGRRRERGARARRRRDLFRGPPRLAPGGVVAHAVDADLRRAGRDGGEEEQGGLLELDLRLAALLLPAPADVGAQHVHAAEAVGGHDELHHAPDGRVVEGGACAKRVAYGPPR